MSNEEQIAYWNSQAGEKWVEMQERLDAQIQPFGIAAIEALAPVSGERIVDVGCGCGATSLALAERVGPSGAVLGLDVSGPMLARARERAAAAGATTVTFVEGDASTHTFSGPPFDALFSRFGVMFFSDPTAAFAALRRGIRPDGRLGFICWQSLLANEWVRIPIEEAARIVPLPAPPPPGAPGPFQLADPDWIHEVLSGAGWSEVGIDSFETEMGIGGSADLDDAVDFLLRIGPLARVIAESADPREHARAVAAALRDRLAASHGQDGVRLGGATWIVTAKNPG